MSNDASTDRKLDRGTLASLVLVIVVLLVSTVVSYRNFSRLFQDAAWVAHTHEVIGAGQSVLEKLLNAETGQRGFLITGVDRYLEPYDTSVIAVREELNRLGTLTRDNLEQQARLPDLREKVEARLSLLQEGIVQRRENGFEGANDLVRLDRGRQAMIDLRAALDDFVAQERGLLAERSQRSEVSYSRGLASGFLTAVLALGSVAAFVLLLRRMLTVRDRAAEAVHREREHLRVTLGSIGDGTIATDTAGRVTFLNAVAESLTGWTLADAQGQSLLTVFHIVHEDTRAIVDNPVTRALQEGVIVGLANHTLLISRDGTERAIADSAAPIRARDGSILGAVLVFRDVSEERKGERELARSEALKSAILDSALDCIITCDHEGQVVEFNPAAERTFGYRREQVLGHEMGEYIVPPSLRDRHLKGMSRYLQTGEARILNRRLELSGLRADGTEFPLEVSIVRIVGDGPPMFTAYLRDITDRKQAELALKQAHDQLERRVAERTGQLAEAKAFLETVLDNIGEGIVACNAAGELTLFNRATRELHGLPLESLPADQWADHYDLFHADGTTRMAMADVPLFRALRGERVQGAEMVIAPKTGDRKLLLVSGEALHDAEGRTVGAVVSMHDVTAQRRAEAALRKSHDELELRVAQRTSELNRVNVDLRLEVAERTRAEADVLAQSELWRTTLASVGDAVLTTDAEGRVTFLNAIAAELTGWTLDDALGRPTETVFNIVNEQSGERVESPVEKVLRTGRIVGLANHTVLIARDGTRLPIDDSGAPIRKGDAIVGVVLVFRDFTERRRSERLLADQKLVLEQIVSDAPLPKVLETLCASVEQQIGEQAIATVLMMDEDGKHLRPAAGRRTPAGYAERLHAVPIGPNIGSCGTSAHLRERVVVSDIQADPRWADFRELAAEFDLRACWSTPILDSRGEVLGTFAVYHRTVHEPSAQEMQLTDLIARTAGIAIGRRRDDENLRHSESRLRIALTASHMVAWEIDPETGKAALSENARDVFGIPADQPVDELDRNFTLLHPEDVDRHRGVLAEAIATAGTYLSHFRIVRPDDGRVLWMEERGSATRDETTNRVRVRGVVLDVTERRRAEEEILKGARELQDAHRLVRDSELQFRTLANSIPQLAWMARADGHIFWYNQRWFDYTGTTLRQMEGWGWKAVHDPVELPRVEEKFRAHLASGEPWEDTFPLRRHDGEMRWHLSRALPVRDDQDEIVLWFGTNTDITDRMDLENDLRRMAADLSEADRRKTEFLATLAHELRNPLAPIRTGLELLKLAADDPRTIEETRGMMERQAAQMVRLIDDLLDLSRITQGKLQLRKARIALQEVVKNSVEATRPFIDEAGHTLHVSVPADPIRMEADPNRLAQVVSNLLSNAAKYTPDGGQIWLSLELDEGTAVFRVRDTGLGIPPDMQARVFEMFAQIDRPVEKGYTGLGIGLTLVKRLVEMHDGTIAVHSAGHGHGSEFTIRLPHVRDLSAPPSTPEPASSAGPSRSLKILVVDDNKAAAETLLTVLRIMGNELRIAHDGEEALQVAEAFRPDVILMDLGMPKLTGYEAARRIRERPWGQSMHLVALTGWGQEEDKQRTREAGFDHHLTKPAEPAAVQALLRSLG